MVNRKRSTNPLKGQALVEVALMLPIMLLLILGAVDFGRLFMTKFILTNAAREGANYLAYYPTEVASSYQVIKDEANSSGVTVVNSEISITNCCTVGLPVTVSITKNVSLIFGGFLDSVGIIDGPLYPISSSVIMVVQHE
jgi:Flp pilus assembly protein TadG